jgi:hypothetical protein
MRVSPTVRAIVIDIDGTVTDTHRRLHPPAIDQLHRLDRRGVPIVIATGNVLPIALALYRFLGLRGPIVAENGGLLYERRADGDHVRRLADMGVALRAYRALARAGLKPRRLFTDRWRESEVGLEDTFDVARARAVLRRHPVDVVSSGFAIHLIQRGVGKLSTLGRALEPYGLTPSDCMVAGDGENDIPMLAAAGWAVSFADAHPKARAVADFVSRRPSGLGLVEALKRARVLPPNPGS